MGRRSSYEVKFDASPVPLRGRACVERRRRWRAASRDRPVFNDTGHGASYCTHGKRAPDSAKGTRLPLPTKTYSVSAVPCSLMLWRRLIVHLLRDSAGSSLGPAQRGSWIQSQVSGIEHTQPAHTHTGSHSLCWKLSEGALVTGLLEVAAIMAFATFSRCRNQA